MRCLSFFLLYFILSGCSANSVNNYNKVVKINVKNGLPVADMTFKVPSASKREYYYRFAPGDTVVFNAWVIKGNDISRVEVAPYKGTPIYSSMRLPVITNKRFTVDTGGIFVFVFKNTSSFKSKIYRFTIHRIPSSSKYLYFNTSVFWDTIYDTTYKWVVESTLIRYRREPERAFFRVIALNPQEKRCMKIDIPENAEYTYYMVGLSGTSFTEQGGRPNILFDMARGRAAIPHIRASKGVSIDYAIDPSRYRALGYIEGRAEHPLKGARKIVMDFGRLDLSLRKCHVCIKNDTKTEESIFLDMVSLLKVPVYTYERVRKPFVEVHRVPK